MVSTHSRPKAAGFVYLFDYRALRRFNTQPPEGGWEYGQKSNQKCYVSTHSRPKAAGEDYPLGVHTVSVSTHSRPKAAGSVGGRNYALSTGFNTQPPEGGWFTPDIILGIRQSFNTQPPEGGWIRQIRIKPIRQIRFNTQPPEGGWLSLIYLFRG